jgi:hypothetical protein
MINFLQIAITNECNFSCWHCPMGKWRNSEKPKFPLNNGELLPFLERYVDPKKWVIELTGGEPTLYEGFDELLEWMSTHGYYTLVKTNGSNPVKHYDNVKVCAAFHRLEQPPRYFDEYLIVDKIQREEKEAYCKERGIPYKVIGYNKENPDDATCGFTFVAFVNPAGHNLSCPADRPAQLVEGCDDYGRINHREFFYGRCCKTCKAAVDAWRFLPDEIKARATQ